MISRKPVKDNTNIVVHLNWIEGELSSGESFSARLSWVPESLESYLVEIYLWDEMNTAFPLTTVWVKLMFL